MLERIRDRNIWVVYAAVLLVGFAYGSSISIVGIFLDARGYTKPDIGSLAVWFALGIVGLSLPMGALIKRFTARAMLVGCLLGYAAMVTIFPFLPTFYATAVVRFFDGAFSVGVWVCCETILLSRSDEKNKAFVTSFYAIALALGYVVGPLLAKLVVALGPMPYVFVAAGALALLAALVVVTKLDADVPETHDAPAEGADGVAESAKAPSIFALLARTKTSCFATFAYGYFQASVVLFLPLYLMEQKGVPKDRTILVTAFFAAGMLLFSNVAGRLGDRVGHLAVMRVLAIIGTTMIAGFVFLDAFPAMCVAVFVAGATLATISPVSLALQGVVTARRNLARANAMYNTFYAAGMLVGPAISSRIYGASGGAAMLWHLAALWVGFIVFSVVFYRDDPAATRDRAAAAA
jgi:MFS family permease